jgi:peptidoglycan/LPS O-acetylase OafA/YrhL
MSDSWIFSLGLGLMFLLGAVIGRRLGPEYRSRRRLSIQTLAAALAFYWVHFGLVVLAAVESTWHFSLLTPVAVGGGIALIASGRGGIPERDVRVWFQAPVRFGHHASGD